MDWWEYCTSYAEESETQISLSVSGNTRVLSSLKTGKPCPIPNDSGIRLL